MKARRQNKVLVKTILSATMCFLLFSVMTICEEPLRQIADHRNCLSIEHCLFSASSSSDKDSSGELPLPIGHHHMGSSSVHNFTEPESSKLSILTNTPALTLSFSFRVPESNLAKSIFNPPRTLI